MDEPVVALRVTREMLKGIERGVDGAEMNVDVIRGGACGGDVAGRFRVNEILHDLGEVSGPVGDLSRGDDHVTTSSHMPYACWRLYLTADGKPLHIIRAFRDGRQQKLHPDNHSVKRHKARRWVVERTISWLNRCRGILVRYEKKAENYLGMLQLGCALLWYRRLHRLTT